MAVTDFSAQPAPAVRAAIKFTPPGTKPLFVAADRTKSYWPTEEHVVPIHSMRPIAGELSLERNGFVLVKHRTALKNAYDPEEVKRVYYPEAIALLKQLTGAEKVVPFAENVRGGPGAGDIRTMPTYGAHIDFADQTVHAMMPSFLGDEEAARWRGRRFMIVNLWQPISTVKRAPLALVDASTVLPQDIIESEIRDANGSARYGGNLSYSPLHRWYYVPDMQPDEVLAFKLFDSDKSRVQLTAHSAFDDPTSAPDAPTRQNIDIRTFCLLPD